jgi:two-component system, chemotaxis family, CheB/CheR fusion protein
MSSKRAANQSASVSPATAIDPPLPQAPLSIVGIGSSAGGLEAFSQLLRHLSIGPRRGGDNETEMAYVLIQHLDPDHPSLLTEILARTTKIPVQEVTDGIAVEPNHVYVIPPNTQMIFAAGRLQLSPRTKTKGVYHPIDLFFRSIAAACGSRAIGIVLSGSDDIRSGYQLRQIRRDAPKCRRYRTCRFYFATGGDCQQAQSARW